MFSYQDKIEMGRLKILAQGRSSQARAWSRGKLFEAMMIQVLHHYGYSADRILHADPAEMEIDISGKHNATGSPLFADCKFYETSVSASKLQAFYGKYMTRWHKDKRCHGLLIALPGVDRSAREFYREHIEGNPQVTALLYEEDQVLKAISRNPGRRESGYCCKTYVPKMWGNQVQVFSDVHRKRSVLGSSNHLSRQKNPPIESLFLTTKAFLYLIDLP